MNEILLIVTPTLGRSPFLIETVRSILPLASCSKYIVVGPKEAQGGVTDEIIQLKEDSLDWEFVVEPNNCGGLYAALNHACDICADMNWDYVTYINDDDLLGAEFKEAWDQYLLFNSKAFSYGKVGLINDDGARLSFVPIEPDARWFEALLVQGISPLNQQGMIIPRALWKKLGGFRIEYKLCADLDFWLRAHRMDWPFKYSSHEVGMFRIREGQLSGDTQKLKVEIAAVVMRDSPRKIGWLEKVYARWQFRIRNLPIYVSRFIRGRQVRGMKILAGK